MIHVSKRSISVAHIAFIATATLFLFHLLVGGYREGYHRRALSSFRSRIQGLRPHPHSRKSNPDIRNSTLGVCNTPPPWILSPS